MAMKVLGRFLYLAVGAVAMLSAHQYLFPPTCPEDTLCYPTTGVSVEAQHHLLGSVVRIEWRTREQMPENVQAFSEWRVDYENNLSLCVIFAEFPELVYGDIRMEALGHELLHCLTGEFHP